MDRGKIADQESSDVVALIPAYNEASHISSVIERTLPYLPVLVVDDGSKDKTANLAELAGAKVVRQKPNQGKGTALKLGFQTALQEGYQAVITIDADGQHAPEEIPQFLDCYRETQADLIIGERDFSKMPALRRTTNTFGRWTFSWALGQPDRDNQSGYRLLSRRLMQAVLEGRERGFEFEVEMIVICVERGYRLEWVPISTIYAGETSHIKPVRHVINWFRLMWQTRMRMRKLGRRSG